MKNASPIGIWNAAHSSSESAKSSSHTVRLPTGRYSASPERSAQHVSQTQRIRRSSRCSRCRCVVGDAERAQLALLVVRRAAAAGGGALGRAEPAEAGDEARPDLLHATATRTVSPSRSSGTGSSCSPSSSRSGPRAAGRTARAHVGQVSVPPLSIAVVERARRTPAQRVAVGEQVAGDVGDHQRRPRTVDRAGRRGGRSSACQPLTGAPPPRHRQLERAERAARAARRRPRPRAPRGRARSPRSACSIASSSVDADAAQPWQRPSSRSRATPSSIPSSSTLPPWDSMYGRTLSSASCTRVSSGTGIEAVDQQQAGDDPVLGEPRAQRLRAVLGDRVEDPLEPLAVELHQRAGELLARRAEVADRSSCAVSSSTRATRASGRALSTAPSACAPPSAPCPCRCTCARRTAGTGRTSGPPA